MIPSFPPPGRLPQYRPLLRPYPPPYPRPLKQMRYPSVLSRGKRMTIAAGLCAMDGVVVCADTEYTYENYKKQASKLFSVEEDQGKIIFAISGHRELAIAAIQKCVAKIRAAKPHSIKGNMDLVGLIETEMEKQYRKHVDPNDASLDYRLLLGVWNNPTEGSALFSTFHGSVCKSEKYECLGIGSQISDRLISEMFNSGMDLPQARIMAAYAVARAKEQVTWVGGKTNIASIRNDGKMESVYWLDTQGTENILKGYDFLVQHLLFEILTADDDGFSKGLHMFSNAVRTIRKDRGVDDFSKSKNAAKWKKFTNHIKNQSARSSPESTIIDPKPPQP